MTAYQTLARNAGRRYPALKQAWFGLKPAAADQQLRGEAERARIAARVAAGVNEVLA